MTATIRSPKFLCALTVLLFLPTFSFALPQDGIPPPQSLPKIAINDITVTEPVSGIFGAIFTVTLSKSVSWDVKVHYATADGTAMAGQDYDATSGDLIIPKHNTSGTIAVLVRGDGIAESLEYFQINLSVDPDYAKFADNQGIATINNLNPSITINDVVLTEGDLGTTNANFNVSLNFLYSAPVSFLYETKNGNATAGSDYTASSGKITIPANTLSVTLSIPIIGDASYEPDETFNVTLSKATNGVIADNQGIGTIQNDDGLPVLSINDVSLIEGNSEQTNFIFTISLSAVSTLKTSVNAATVQGTATAGVDFSSLNSTTVTLPAGSLSAIVTVQVNGDALEEPIETFTVNLSNPINATIAKGVGTGSILDDDGNNVPVLDPIGDKTTDEKQLLQFTISATDPDDDQTLTYSATGLPEGSEFNATTHIFTWTPSEAQGPNIHTSITFSVSDGVDTTSQTITITVNEVNQTPILDPIADQTGEADDPITFTAHATDDDLPANGLTFSLQGTIPAGATIDPQTGAFTWTPTTGQAGQHTITVRVNDNGTPNLFDVESFNVQVDAVVPTISINDVSLNEGTPIPDFPTLIVATFTVNLSAATTVPVTIDFTTQDGTAIAPEDYTARSGSLTFAAGETTKQIAVTITADAVYESDENFVVNLSNPTNATILNSTGTATILNDDAPPTSVSIADATVVEGNSPVTQAQILISLAQPIDGLVSVTVTASNGTATSPSDYAGFFDPDEGLYVLSKTVTFGAGEISQTIEFTVKGDTTVEEDETVNLTLSNPTNASIADGNAVITIVADDVELTALDDDYSMQQDSSIVSGAVRVKRHPNSSGTDLEASEMTTMNGTLFYNIRPQFGVSNHGLWKSNGTSEGTVQLKANSRPKNLTAVNGTLFFSEEISSNPTLWKSDGTPQGTILVKDSFAAPDGWSIHNLRNVNGTLFFMITVFDEEGSRNELWKSDGTLSGTVLVLDAGISDTVDVSNGFLYFKTGPQLWRSDGTAQGTFKISDAFGSFVSDQHSIDVNGTLFFMSGFDLWKTDGTLSGTIQVRSLDQQTIWLEMANLNGSLLYSTTVDTRVFGPPCDPGPPEICTVISGTITTEVWKTDQTGTVLLKTFDAGIAPFAIHTAAAHLLTRVNETLFFIFKRQLWKTDGTPEGTIAVGSPDFPQVSDLTNGGGTLFFKNGPARLWMSDGTAEGTVQVANVTDQSGVGPLVAGKESIFFNASSAIEGDFEIWTAGREERPSANDSFIGHPTVTVHLESGPSHGALAFMPDGSFSYVPNEGFLGEDVFTYSLSGGGVTSNIATVTIQVSGENSPPVLDPIGNKTVNEGQLLTFRATATDPNSGQTLTFSLQGDLPSDAGFDPVTGVFNWTPGNQHAGVYETTITVNDNGTPPLSDQETITITVNDIAPVNHPPVLSGVPAGTQTLTTGDTLSFQASGTDPDPTDTLIFSLQGTVPTGASIDSQTGAFTWTPTAGQEGQHTIIVRVTDNGTPPLFDEKSFLVTVNPGISTVRWNNPNGGDWNTASNWDLNRVPGSNDDVIIDLSGNYSVTYSTDASPVKTLNASRRIELTGGTLTVNGTANLSFLNLTGGTATFNGDTTITTLSQFDGTLTGSGTVTVTGRGFQSRWDGGSMSGSGTTVMTGDFSGGGGGTLTLNRTFIQNNASTIEFNGTLINNGLYDIQTGTLHLADGGSTTRDGIFNVTSGATLDFSGFAAHQFTGNGGITGNGTVEMRRGFVKRGTGTTTTVTPTVIVFNMSAESGTLVLSGTVTNNGEMIVEQGATMIISGRLTNYDVATSTLNVGLFNTAHFIIRGTLRVANANIVTNKASILLDGPTSQFLDTTGAHALANFTKNEGFFFTLANGRDFTTGGSFTNDGGLFLYPGSTLTVSGSYTSASQGIFGQVNLVISGTNPDQVAMLAVNGTANLNFNSGLVVEFVEGLYPNVGDRFTVMTFASRTGDYQFPTLPPGTYLDKSNPTKYDLVYDPSLTGVHWITPAGGDWNTASNWSTNRVPGPDDDVFIDLPGNNFTVSHVSGNSTVRSITTNHPINLMGGTLTVTGTLKMTDTFLTLSGGTLTRARVDSLSSSNPPAGFVGIHVPSNQSGTLDGITMMGTNFGASNILVDTNATLNISWLEMKGTFDIRGTALVQEIIGGRSNLGRATVTIENGGVLKASTGGFTIGPYSMVGGDGELGSMITQVTNTGEIHGQSGVVLDVFNVLNEGLLAIDDGSVIVNGGLNNHTNGLLLLTNGNTLQVNGDFSNTGTVHVLFNGSGQIGLLNVVGPATIEGKLSIDGSSFDPPIGNRYPFMMFTNRDSYFTTTEVLNFPAGKTATVDQSDTTDLEIVIEPN